MISITISVISLIVALVSVVYNIYRQYVIDERSQAEKVYIKEMVKVLDKQNPYQNTNMYSYYSKCIIYNNSDEPIHHVIAASSFILETNNLQQNIDRYIGDEYTELIYPGLYTITIETYDNSSGGGYGIPMILFTDSHGREWIRYPNGELKKEKYFELMRIKLTLLKTLP